MYTNSNSTAAQYLSCADTALTAQCVRLGCEARTLRALLQLASLRACGAGVTGADVVRAGLGHAVTIRAGIAECVSLGWAVRVGRHGLDITQDGRAVVAETARAWERAAKQLATFRPAQPYARRGRGCKKSG